LAGDKRQLSAVGGKSFGDGPTDAFGRPGYDHIGLHNWQTTRQQALFRLPHKRRDFTVTYKTFPSFLLFTLNLLHLRSYTPH